MFNKNLLVFNTNIVVSHKKIFLKAVVKSLSEIFFIIDDFTLFSTLSSQKNCRLSFKERQSLRHIFGLRLYICLTCFFISKQKVATHIKIHTRSLC